MERAAAYLFFCSLSYYGPTRLYHIRADIVQRVNAFFEGPSGGPDLQKTQGTGLIQIDPLPVLDEPFWATFKQRLHFVVETCDNKPDSKAVMLYDLIDLKLPLHAIFFSSREVIGIP